jgi:hypothetical protein
MKCSVSARTPFARREENRRPGLPNVDGRDGKLIFEMPDGTIVTREIPPAKKD